MIEPLDTEVALSIVCKGNLSAMRFLEQVTTIFHLWDDLIDKDKVLTDQTINETMWMALVDLPRNEFYNNNFAVLNMGVMTAITNWEVATKMERNPQNDNDLTIAFIIRSSYMDLVTAVALIVGGRQHAIDCMVLARRYCHSEGLEGFKAALVKEKEARDVQTLP